MREIKQLTISNLKQMDIKQYGEKKSVIINDYEIVIDTKFRITKIQAMVTEMLKKQEEVIEKEPNFDITVLTTFYIIKTFTNLGESLVNSTLEDDIKVYSLLIDNNIAQELSKIFDGEEYKDEMQKFLDYIDDAKNNIEKIAEEMAKTKEITEQSEI